MVAIGPDGMPVNMGAITQLLQELRIDNVVIADIMSALADGVDPSARWATAPRWATTPSSPGVRSARRS